MQIVRPWMSDQVPHLLLPYYFLAYIILAFSDDSNKTALADQGLCGFYMC